MTLWTVTCQAPLSMAFSRQEPWSGLPCPPPGDLPGPGVEPGSPMSPTLAGFFSTSVTRKAHWNGDIEAKTTMLSWLCFYLACSSVQGTVWVSVSLSVKQVILGLLRLSGVIRIT